MKNMYMGTYWQQIILNCLGSMWDKDLHEDLFLDTSGFGYEVFETTKNLYSFSYGVTNSELVKFAVKIK